MHLAIFCGVILKSFLDSIYGFYGVFGEHLGKLDVIFF